MEKAAYPIPFGGIIDDCSYLKPSFAGDTRLDGLIGGEEGGVLGVGTSDWV